MLRRVVILLVLAWLGSSFALASDIKPLMDDTISPQMTETVPLVADSLLMHSQIAEVPLVADSTDVDDKDAWKRKIFRHGWSINDTTIKYPMVLDFGVKTYRWLNHALNYYDTTYVVNPGKTSGKKWKIMIKNNNWLDFYSGHLTTKRTYLQLNSDITSLFGFQICGMGLSFTYMINVRDLLAGNFSVLSVDAYMQITGLYDLKTGAFMALSILLPAMLAFFIQKYWVARKSFVTITGKPVGNIQKIRDRRSV